MKKFYLPALGLMAFSASYAQQPGEEIAGTSEYIKCTSFSISKPLRELTPITEEEMEKAADEYAKENEGKNQRMACFEKVHPNALPLVEDPAWQKTMGTREVMSNPIVSWNGLSGAGFPPDPTGAAGSQNHYVQAVNTQY